MTRQDKCLLVSKNGDICILPKEVWRNVAKHLHDNDLFSFAMTCKVFREAQVAVDRVEELTLNEGKTWRKKKCILLTDSVSVSESWIRWAVSVVWKDKHSSNSILEGEVCRLAALRGHLEVLKWLCEEEGYQYSGVDILTAASREGHLEILKWIITRTTHVAWNNNHVAASYAAALGGHLEILRWLWSQGCRWNNRHILANAARGGHLDVLKWAMKREKLGLNEEEAATACISAAAHDQVVVLKWLRHEGYPSWKCALISRHANANQSLQVMEWLKKQDY